MASSISHQSVLSPQFVRHVGIDYSGAETPDSSLRSLQVYSADQPIPPVPVPPPPGPKKHWTRRGIAEWIVEVIMTGQPTLFGIDHAFSFPNRYFERYHILPDWDVFLDDFCAHWPTDHEHMYVDFIRDGAHGNGAERVGDPSWLRLTEKWTTSAKSVFKFDVQGAVAKSTHAGIPWLRYIREKCRERVHFWPFDGWTIPAGRSAIVEVYPSIWHRRIPQGDRNGDQHSAFVTAAWLHRSDANGSLNHLLDPPLNGSEKTLARVEGWICGVS